MIRLSPPQAAGLKKPGSRARRQVVGICLALAVITFAVFAPTLAHDFVNFDDDAYVYENQVVAQGVTWKGLAWAFSSHANNWHPLTWFSHMLDCQLYGLHPAGHHLTNILLHMAAVLGLFLVLRQMTGALWRSAFVAAIFAVHPLRVESVAWVAERKDVLSGFFFVLTLAAYTRYARLPRSLARYSLVLLLFALGLMSKPMLMTVPAVLLLLDFWPLQRAESMGKLVVEKLPLLALSAGCLLVTIFAQDQAVHLGASLSVPFRLRNAAVAGMVYLGQMFWPSGLAIYYPYPFKGYPSLEVALAILLPVAISLWAWRERRVQPWLLVGWLWYLIMLLPVVGLIQVGGQAHADRYTYLPGIGIALAVTWLAAKWLPSRATPVLMAGLVASLMLCASQQVAYWQNSQTLWTRDLACTTDNELAHDNLAAVFMQKGRLPEAIAEYQEALRISPHFELTHLYLARALLQEGKLAEALAQYRAALQIDPEDATVQCNLAWILATAPEASLRNGAEAVRLARQAAAATKGKDPVVLGALAAALAETSQFAGAIQTAQKGINLAKNAGQEDLVRRLTVECQRYRAGKPLR